MLHIRMLGVCLSFFLTAAPLFAEDKNGFVPMFDGRTLDGWVNVNCHPSTFYVKDGEIITTGRPTGYLRTAKQYENFIAEFDWMHENKTKVGNSGFFVWCDPLPAVGTGYSRGIEVQVLVNLEYKNKKGEITATSHGDLFSIWGARCKPDRPHPDGWERCLPSENRAKGGGEWNHYKVTAYHGTLKLEVNGKLVSGVSQCTPRKGYLALESEGAVCHFRNLKIKELPSTNPKSEEIAKVDQGHVLMFNGLDLAGWKGESGDWKPADGVLQAGKSPIESEKKFSKCELQFDWKAPAKAEGTFAVVVNGQRVAFNLAEKRLTCQVAALSSSMPRPGSWARVKINFDGEKFVVSSGDKPLIQMPMTSSEATPIKLEPLAGLELRSIYIRELK
jgi:hypothetical protein